MSSVIAPPSTSIRTSAEFHRITRDSQELPPAEPPVLDADDSAPTATAELNSAETLAETIVVPDDQPAPAQQPAVSEPRRIVVEADEIVFKAGGATFTLKNDGNGTIEIAAGSIVLKGEEITSAADQTHTTKGTMVVSEAAKFSDLLGKLIRINGQCVKINC